MIDASLRVLRTDVAGMPIEWIGFEEAVRLHCLDQILYPMGSVLYHCLLYTSPSPRDGLLSRMPSSA